MKIVMQVFMLVAALMSCRTVLAEDNNFDYQTVTTKEGLTYRVPPDMPIETRNGIQAPIPFDEYIYGKFKKLEIRLSGMESKLDKIEKLILSMQEENKKAAPLTS